MPSSAVDRARAALDGVNKLMSKSRLIFRKRLCHRDSVGTRRFGAASADLPHVKL